MALKKRNGVWWVDITHNGNRIRKSTKTEIKSEAQIFHDKFNSELWEASQILKTPKKEWQAAATRWLDESCHKRSLVDDKTHLRWLAPFLKATYLTDITTEMIENIAKKKEQTGVSAASVNRMLEVVRAILRKAHKEWGWLQVVPAVRMRKEDNHRIRWLTYREADRLIKELPTHLKDMALFTLATGLRQSNVTDLKWCDVDLTRCHALVHPEDSKTGRAIPVPLNQDAIDILTRQKGKSPIYVFTYNGHPVTRCNNHAWRKALVRAGINDFRWHDLRHTWASWHVQNGTSLQELQQLGGWSSFEMVLRYAHLSSDHLKHAAQRIQRNTGNQQQAGLSY